MRNFLSGPGYLTATPAGVDPDGRETEPSSEGLPPLTVNWPTVATRLSLT